MIKNYFLVAFRGLIRQKTYAVINIAGLASGMAVAILIGLWIWDELNYDRDHKNYDRIAEVWQHITFNGKVESGDANPFVMAEEIRSNFGSDFRYVLEASWNESNVLTFGEKKFNKDGSYFEPAVAEMLSLTMLRGTRDGLQDPHSILLSASTAKAFFGDIDPLNKIMRVNNSQDVKVTGVYEDLPDNSSFREMDYILPWKLYLITGGWEKMADPWSFNFTRVFVQLADHVDIEKVSEKLKNVRLQKLKNEDLQKQKPVVFLLPMRMWRLHSEFKNGINVGGRIELVWLFGVIGVFVLLLACINFMNLSTARSEKRAKEVGIRKCIGSVRSQLIFRFFSESLIMAFVAFFVALVMVQLTLPTFNQIAQKNLALPWLNVTCWTAGVCFIVLTGVIAGSYPALYLSSFAPIKVLKGTFRAGRFAAVPRKALVVVQFTVSVALTIGTIIVYEQIQFAKSRPIGYERHGLIHMRMPTGDIHQHFEAVRTELKSSGAIIEMAEAGSPTTSVENRNGGFEWRGKDPSLSSSFPTCAVTHGYGKTIGWQFIEGRDFERERASDSSALVINETASRFFGFKNPVGERITWNKRPITIIGVIKDMVVESPYGMPRPSLFYISRYEEGFMLLKLNPTITRPEAIGKIESVFKKYNPASPFEYKFVDEDYTRKFNDEERVGVLTSFFAALAIFISSLGIFGLASFVSEQRTKEIGIRKVLGASVTALWKMLSGEFVLLTGIAVLIGIPIAIYVMSGWLLKYEYRTAISWWMIAAVGIGGLSITLATVSYQAIKAALSNPVNSLRMD
jgi:ABC-type antimicrobial peptide transport system permease subunit